MKYMFGAATADGAILSLMAAVHEPEADTMPDAAEAMGERIEENAVSDSNMETSTHHCDAHRLSLAARWAFKLKEQRQIILDEEDVPGMKMMTALNDLLKSLVNYYSADYKFNQLRVVAKKLSQPEPLRMNEWSDTRFLSYGILINAVYRNLPLFSAYNNGFPSDQVPDEVIRLFEPQTMIFQRKTYKLIPEKEITAIYFLTDATNTLIKYSEGSDVDPCLLQLYISRFLAVMNGDLPLTTFGSSFPGGRVSDLALMKNSYLVEYVALYLKRAVAFYFDRNMEKDWAMLLCLALHPICGAGRYTDRRKLGQLPGEKQPMWPPLRTRFSHLWYKEGNNAVQDDPAEKRVKVMKAGEKVLHEEALLQWNIDNSSRIATHIANNNKKRRRLAESSSHMRKRAAASCANTAFFSDDDEDDVDDDVDDEGQDSFNYSVGEQEARPYKYNATVDLSLNETVSEELVAGDEIVMPPDLKPVREREVQHALSAWHTGDK